MNRQQPHQAAVDELNGRMLLHTFIKIDGTMMPSSRLYRLSRQSFIISRREHASITDSETAPMSRCISYHFTTPVTAV
jgi:hypothetical protein